jgi:hypothetical protein
VTLTSTGFGDIAPVHPLARMLANIEGITSGDPARAPDHLGTARLPADAYPLSQTKRRDEGATGIAEGSPNAG